MGTKGGRVLSFRKKRKNQRKVDFACRPQRLLSSGVFLGGYIREGALLSCDACFAQSQRRSLFHCLWLTLTIICIRFGIPRMEFSCLGRLRPRHVRHPSAAQMQVRR